MNTFFRIFFARFLYVSITRADLIIQMSYDGNPFTVAGSQSEAWSDSISNSTTIHATLLNNPMRTCWECRFWDYQTGSPNLISGKDVTLNTDLFVRFQIYPNGHPQAPKYFYVYGGDVRNVNYSTINSTIQFNFRPVALAISASYGGGYTAIAGVDFPYYGSGQVITYTPPIVTGNIVWDDLSRAQHNSSRYLLGAAVRINGVNNQLVSFEFLIGTQYATYKKYDLNQAQGWLDGNVQGTGFTWSLGNPTTTITTDVPNDTFKRLAMQNFNWSAHDVQAGTFLRFTNIVREPGGVRLYWNVQTTNRYTVEHYPTLGGPTNIVGTNLTGPILDPSALTNAVRFYRVRAQ